MRNQRAPGKAAIAAAVAYLAAAVGAGSLCRGEEGSVSAILEPNRDVGVAFNDIPQGFFNVYVSLIHPEDWHIVTDADSSKVIDKSGDTIWNRLSANNEVHFWEGLGLLDYCWPGVLFGGNLTKAGAGPGTAPLFRASIADIDIDVDSKCLRTGSPPNQWPPTGHWPPDGSRDEDEAEATQAGGLYLPPALYTGQFPSALPADCDYKILNLTLNTHWVGPGPQGDPDPGYVGDLTFETTGSGFAIYELTDESNGTLVTGPLPVYTIGYPAGKTFGIVTNQSFVGSGSIKAKFTWKSNPNLAGWVDDTATDFVRVAPIPAVTITGLTQQGSPVTSATIGLDLWIDYAVNYAGGFSFDSMELEVHNGSGGTGGVMVYKRTDLDKSYGNCFTSWERVQWNQTPHSGAYANPKNGSYKVQVVGKRGYLVCPSETTVGTVFVVAADVKDEKPPGADPTAEPAGLDDLADALKVQVIQGTHTRTFSGAQIALSDIANGKHVTVSDAGLNSLPDGEWTVLLKDVRDAIGNFYSGSSNTWQVKLY